MIKVITHAGRHHSDEVLTCAAVQLMYGNDNVEIIRVNRLTPDDVETLQPRMILDIRIEGENKCRGDGNPLHLDHHGSEDEDACTFRQWWRIFGRGLVREVTRSSKDERAHKISAICEELLVVQTDLRDRGKLQSYYSSSEDGVPVVRVTTIADYICMLDFDRALECGRNLITKTIEVAAQKVDSIAALECCEVDSGVLIMKEGIPWKEWAYNQEGIVFGMSPGRSPEEWAGHILGLPGKPPKALFPKFWIERPPAGVSFVHKDLFLISGTYEGVLAALKSLR